MKIDIVGGGPSGLFFAYLIKRDRPEYRVRIFEQNPADATFGFGVVFSGRALHYLAKGDAPLVEKLSGHMQRWADQHINLNGETVVIDGSDYAAIERLTLLRELQAACLSIGVEIEFNHRATSSDHDDCDVLVAADGSNSALRDSMVGALGTRITDLRNFFAWYGVEKPYAAHTLTFLQRDDGIFCGHHYRYTPMRSTFVAEVDEDTWFTSGMNVMTDEQRQSLFEEIFAATLDGKPLLNNRSSWRRYRLIENDRWYSGKTVLLGDALRTAHPSIGSGTRLAMEDAISLWESFITEGENVAKVFERYAATRAPIRNKLNAAAGRSISWYENIKAKIGLSLYDFAYDYTLRTGIMTPERLAHESPVFSRAYEDGRATSDAKKIPA